MVLFHTVLFFKQQSYFVFKFYLISMIRHLCLFIYLKEKTFLYQIGLDKEMYKLKIDCIETSSHVLGLLDGT